MSEQIEVRLLYPNLGQPAGAVVSMEPGEARKWFARRLAVNADEPAGQALSFGGDIGLEIPRIDTGGPDS